MATFLPASGALSINDINTLFARGNDLNSYRSTTYYTSSAGPFTFSSGAISMSSFYGTGPSSARPSVSYTFTTSTANASLNIATIGGYTAGTSDVTVTVNSSVYLYATSTGNAGLSLSGGTSGDTLNLVNNGYIIGQAGNGANSGGTAPSGGPALSLGFYTTITNNSYIAGGGGGGGGYATVGGGGGAGGGNGGGSGGAGGGTGSAGANGSRNTCFLYAAGGGRQLPGSGGLGANFACGACLATGGGAGGGGGTRNNGSGCSLFSVGGNGGGSNNVGNPGHCNCGTCQIAGGGGGGWGASGGNAGKYPNVVAAYGGAGGKAINLNGNGYAFAVTGTIYGGIS
jgi:hypothetical protein